MPQAVSMSKTMVVKPIDHVSSKNQPRIFASRGEAHYPITPLAIDAATNMRPVMTKAQENNLVGGIVDRVQQGWRLVGHHDVDGTLKGEGQLIDENAIRGLWGLTSHEAVQTVLSSGRTPDALRAVAKEIRQGALRMGLGLENFMGLGSNNLYGLEGVAEFGAFQNLDFMNTQVPWSPLYREDVFPSKQASQELLDFVYRAFRAEGIDFPGKPTVKEAGMTLSFRPGNRKGRVSREQYYVVQSVFERVKERVMDYLRLRFGHDVEMIHDGPFTTIPSADLRVWFDDQGVSVETSPSSTSKGIALRNQAEAILDQGRNVVVMAAGNSHGDYSMLEMGGIMSQMYTPDRLQVVSMQVGDQSGLGEVSPFRFATVSDFGSFLNKLGLEVLGLTRAVI